MPTWSQFRMDASRHISRSAGQSAIAAAAYRSGEKLYDDRTQETHDYTNRFGVVASGLEMPDSGGPDWDREELWNAAEAAEKRKDARVARKIELALPAEMTPEQRIELAEGWAKEIANKYGVAVDWAVHLPDQQGDQRNHHVHIMTTTREITPEGFQGKAALELSNTDQKKRGLPVGDDAIYDLRETLATKLNEVAARHGLELHADPRSYAAQGIDLTPTKHIGVHAVAMDRRGLESERVDIHADIKRENARRVMDHPELALEALTRREAVFTRRDMARELHRYLDDPDQFQSALARLETSPALVRLSQSEGESTYYSTREMIAVETRMMEAAERLRDSASHAVALEHLRAAQARHARLSDEQRTAVAHITGPEQIACIAGAAGAGKSASLEAAREAWEAEGYRVRGAALAGKAAEELQLSAGIESRTIHALEYSWRNGRDQLTRNDVLVIDEAGMVGSRQMGRVLDAAQEAGAKVVLVGDARQLQPIEAGAAFRAITEQVGVVEIETIRRQRQDWAREASQAFAAGSIGEGIAAYAERGHVELMETREAAKEAMARDSVAALDAGASTLILAHTNEDVRTLNELVRLERKRKGGLGEGASFETERGERDFAAGDRVVFLKNDRELGVKNGTLATVEQAGPGQLVAQLDGGGRVTVDQATYRHIDHGYAVTLHKAQGATVDRTYVLASGGMDQHLTYVGMTRHRDEATLYAGQDDFKDQDALARRLSRARPKVSSLDFAERRGFETAKPWVENTRAWMDRGRERLAEIWERAERVVAAVRERLPGLERSAEARADLPVGRVEKRKAPGMFDGLKLTTGRSAPREGDRDMFEGMRVPMRERRSEPTPAADELTHAADRYARAWTDAARMQADNLPILDYQKIALRDAGAALDAARPGAADDLLTALEHEKAAQRAMTQLQGRERALQLVAWIEREARVRQDPNLKAERLVKVWNELEAQRDRLSGYDQAGARGQVEASMKEIVRELKRDAQLESLVRNRQRELGVAPGSRLDRVLRERDINQALDFGPRRERGMGMGM